ncbi:DUF1553 domain-containing protein [Reichenbachiella sp.]|uniref:DUF1553 domain-containing protein n=1 Tax=Reichenbachiella sp. TaxID=2184521 RepID=UPI003BB01518
MKNQKFCLSLVGFVMVLGLQNCSPSLPEGVEVAYEKLPQSLDFNIHVKPILSDKCFACHGPDKGKIEAGLQLHDANTAYGELPESPGKRAVVPGNLSSSELFHRIVSDDPNMIMPPPASKIELSDYEKAVLTKWIENGAEYKPHWAFEKPVKPKPPAVKFEKQVNNVIDQFILKRLDEEGLKPAKSSDRSLLLRRLSLDLTGLPPTVEEIENFVNDHSPTAYEKQVDRLLASRHYGEKMAVDWMDLSRFSDTYGYQVDFYRDMSPWRDWVIQSFNDNMPYDQFVTWQLAGDLLPNATTEQILATGYNRLHAQNSEDGIIEEEYRVEQVIDRTSVVGQGLMGLTVACARCHDHKYDPISHKEFYSLYSFFNNVNESGQISRDPMDIPVPTLLIPTEAQTEAIAYLKKIEQEQEAKLMITKSENEADKWIAAGSFRQLAKSSLNQGMVAHFSLEGHLKNTITGKSGQMARMYTDTEPAIFRQSEGRSGLHINGDSWLDLKPVGIYGRDEAFSIGLWVKLPDTLKEGVIFHKNKGVRLHGYKGYHLYYREGKLEVMLAHTWPDNAIEKLGTRTVPTNEWVQLTLTYDGSSHAEGVKLYINGEEEVMTVKNDNLYKDILFHDYIDEIYPEPLEPGLKVGGRWRGFGIKDAIVDDIMVYSRELTAFEVLQLTDNQRGNDILAKAADELTAYHKALLSEYYWKNISGNYKSSLEGLQKTRAVLADSMDAVKEVMVMKEMQTPRQAYVLLRGQYDNYGEPVSLDTPSTILPMDDSLPKNRLGLANWFFDKDHPLTARVAVNRYWQHLFGRGIVRTSEDFGNQGELPSHPELLDWLAIWFMENEWDVKALHKLMVMSATYQQDTYCSPELREKDPDNVLLARGPQARLTSEMIRDNALAASDLLVPQIGGESVRPYQPEGLWIMNSNKYEPGSGDDLYRRSLYSIWKRSVPLPTQATFDQPDRNECTVRRQKTNTPLQALVLLNDPTFVETSRKIGEQITQADDSAEAIRQTFVKLTGRKPAAEEMNLLQALQQDEYKKFKADETRAKGWLETGVYRVDPSLDTNLVAANAVVASVILNTDATITKR